MIVAVLTCLFVIYLYRSLNADTAGTTNHSAEDGQETESLAQLMERLERLEYRIRTLANENSAGGDSP
ncbi:MAG: hypothetical protein KDA93_09095 [Planctomycetaceae bacterium]|nr:hypothetical protein [Planctomycetaceae bacterium]